MRIGRSPGIDDGTQLARPHRHLTGQAQQVRPLQEHQRPLPPALRDPGGVLHLSAQPLPKRGGGGGGGEGRRGSVLREPERFSHRERDLGEDVVPRGRRPPGGPGDGEQDTKRCIPAKSKPSGFMISSPV